MMLIALAFMITLMGFFVSLIGLSGFLPFPIGLMVGFMGTMFMFMGFITLFSGILQKKLQIFFKKLKKNEEYSFDIDKRGKIFPIIIETKHEGVAFSRGMGWVEEKGQPLTTWFGEPAHISLRGLGVTYDPQMGGYFTALRKDKNIENYESALRKALGTDLYAKFCKYFREKPETQRDVYDVHNELKWLIQQKVEDKLAMEIAGEQLDVYDMFHFMIYAYDPHATENAIERERIIARDEALAYAPAAKAMGYAMAIVIIIIGVVIALYAVQGIDFGSFFGG